MPAKSTPISAKTTTAWAIRPAAPGKDSAKYGENTAKYGENFTNHSEKFTTSPEKNAAFDV